MAYDFDRDLNTIQKLLIADKEIMRLMDLTGKPNTEIGKRIVKKSRYDDLMSADKRLCLYPLRSRGTRNSVVFEEIIEIDCHVPSMLDSVARQVVGRVVDVLNNRCVNGRYLNFKGQLGELSTASGFYCCGVRFGFFSPF